MKQTNRHNNTAHRRHRESSYDKSTKSRFEAGGYDVSKLNENFLTLYKAFGFFVTIALVALFNYQILQHSELSSDAYNDRCRQSIIYAKRGTIYDRNGNVLAYSEDCKAVCANPSQINSVRAYAKILAARLGGDEDTYAKILDSNKTFAYINRQVDSATAKTLLNDFTKANLPGIYLEESQMRVYPYHEVGNQVLGLVNIDGDGITGIEKQYDSILKGENGMKAIEVGINGTPIAGGTHKIVEAKDGTDIVLSLDINIQKVAEENIADATKEFKAESGSVVALDPKTGGILAMCSTPFADFGDMSHLQNDALQLKPINDSYEPGSTFKTIAMAIALDNGVVTPNTTYTVPVSRKVGDDIVKDAHKRSCATNMTTTEMMRVSSNVGLSMVGEAVGKDKFAAGLEKFKIGQRTGVDFPGEAAGIVQKRDEYTGASVGAMSFGQGLAIPLLQTTRATAAIANDGVMLTPHFLEQKGSSKVNWGDGVEVCSNKTANELTEMLRGVVQGGTGVLAQIDRYDVAGKTGTAQVASSEGGYKENTYMSSFIGFANADNPSVVVSVSLNGTSQLAGSSGAPTFKKVMQESLIDLGVKPVW